MDLTTSVTVETLESFNRLLLSFMSHYVVQKLDDLVEGKSLSFLYLREVVVEISQEELIVKSQLRDEL